MKYLFPILFLCVVASARAQAPDARAQAPDVLLQKVRARLDQVNDYQATGIMKTNVPFLKVLEAQVTIYFK